MKFLSPHNAQQLIQKNTLFIDVSTVGEFNASYIEKADNYPLANLLNDLKHNLFKNPQNQLIILTCQSGTRAQIAAKALIGAGFEVNLIDGGNQSWIESQLPIIRGEGVINLERQIRIVTGGLGLLGSLLAVFVAPLFVLIPLIIGAGLLNAGLTNWCGMGMVLAKMPWNTRTSASC